MPECVEHFVALVRENGHALNILTQLHRAGLLRCGPSSWPRGWVRTCPSWILMVSRIDDLHIGSELVLVAALGIVAHGAQTSLGLVEGEAENASVVRALTDNLIGRAFDPRSAGCSTSMATRR